MIRPPARRHVSIRIALFFLAAASLAWPIDMVIREEVNPSQNPSALSAQYQVLPPSHAPKTSASHRQAVKPTRIPFALMLFAVQIAVIILLGRNLHSARIYNQKKWGPAFERWSASQYCNGCGQAFLPPPREMSLPEDRNSGAACTHTPAA